MYTYVCICTSKIKVHARVMSIVSVGKSTEELLLTKRV